MNECGCGCTKEWLKETFSGACVAEVFGTKKYLAELVGTMVLVLMGCGVAVSLGCDNANAASVVGTAFAFGLAVVAMAYTIGGISGCHINPAITLGVMLSGRMDCKEGGRYMVAQCIGGFIGAFVLFLLTVCVCGLSGVGANDLQDGVGIFGGLLAEIVFTCVFVLVVLGATSKTNGATNNLAGLVIGLTLVLVHLVCIRYTGTSVNPARSIGPALFTWGGAFWHLWIFIVGPFVGAALAAWLWKLISGEACCAEAAACSAAPAAEEPKAAETAEKAEPAEKPEPAEKEAKTGSKSSKKS